MLNLFAVRACVSVPLCRCARLWPCSTGGVVLTGLGDAIKCDNTLDTRAKLAIRDLEPVVRYLLFPTCRSKILVKPDTSSANPHGHGH